MRNHERTYLGILGTVFLLVPVPTDGVIIEAGIFDQSDPFAPPRWDVAAIVLIEVLAKEGCRAGREEKEGCFQIQSLAISACSLCSFKAVLSVS